MFSIIRCMGIDWYIRCRSLRFCSRFCTRIGSPFMAIFSVCWSSSMRRRRTLVFRLIWRVSATLASSASFWSFSVMDVGGYLHYKCSWVQVRLQLPCKVVSISYWAYLSWTVHRGLRKLCSLRNRLPNILWFFPVLGWTDLIFSAIFFSTKKCVCVVQNICVNVHYKNFVKFPHSKAFIVTIIVHSNIEASQMLHIQKQSFTMALALRDVTKHTKFANSRQTSSADGAAVGGKLANWQKPSRRRARTHQIECV